MGVLNFEAYWLEYTQKVSEGFYDENGDYAPGDEVWVPLGRVNAAPPSGPNIINLPDGHTDTFSYTIHIHNPRCRDFHHGDKIRITDPYGEKRTLTVKGFARHQNKCIITA